ncbi:MAG: DUF3459 domain-containing protein, partial [Bosea sp. (in: a-proteobacteria)]|uniref:DUF3459 domain-containing protein n=1 Tax=Bosea sp. (in: a-proteobacteria) TaxID=1871050 RepID=UPI003F7CBFD1
HEELAQVVREGRKREFSHADAGADRPLFDPNSVETFAASVPAASEDAREWGSLYRRLIALRQEVIVPRLDDCRSLGAITIGSHAVRASWSLGGGVLTLLANFGDEAVGGETPEGMEIFRLADIESRLDGSILGPRSFRAFLS